MCWSSPAPIATTMRFSALREIADQPATFLWHESEDLENCDAIVVPGGFAYGDYLRTGAIARFSPVMQSVKKFAAGGGLVLGICNGFQILCESGMLPGALLRNAGLRYICKQVYVRTETANSPFTQALTPRPGVEDPDRAYGGKLLLRTGHAGRTGARRPDRLPLLHPGRTRLPPPPTPMAPLVALPGY